MSLRQPISLPLGFGPRPSMSFFLYNQDGRQAIARPYLDGVAGRGRAGPRRPPTPPPDMPKYHAQGNWDAGDQRSVRATSSTTSTSIATSFGDGWREVLAARRRRAGACPGSVDALVEAFSRGREVKVGVRGPVRRPGRSAAAPSSTRCSSGSARATTTPSRRCSWPARIRSFGSSPAVPLLYESRGWDFGWLMVRTDGRVVYRRCDPYTLEFQDRSARHPIRWFVDA